MFSDDKVLHFTAGFVVFLMALIFTGPSKAFALGVSIAIGKETWDHLSGGNVEFWDVFSTVFGSLIAWVWYGAFSL